MTNKTLVSLLLGMTLVLAGGFAWSADAGDELDPKLKARVSEYWNATVARDWATTYRLEMKYRDNADPQDPMTYYKEKQLNSRFRVAMVDRIEQKDDQATAKISASEIKAVGGAAFQIPRFIESHWQRFEGDWYQVDWAFYIPEALLKIIEEEKAAKAAQTAAAEAAACQANPQACAPPPKDTAAPIQEDRGSQ